MFQYLLAGFGVISNLGFLRELVCLLLRPFGIHYYAISGDRDIVRKFLRPITKEGIITSQRIYSDLIYPSGLCISWKFLAWVASDSPWLENWTVHILCRESYYQRIVDEKEIVTPVITETVKEDVVKKETVKTISMLWRKGTFDDLHYGRTKIDVADLAPLGDQRQCADEILSQFRKKKFVKAFIHGAPGTGKSALGILLAKELNGFYCHTFDPTTPGDQWETVFGTYKDYDSDAPLVVVVEEANKLIEKLHEDRVVQHVKMPTSVRNKATWCNFMDDLVFYKNVIFLLTSNASKQDVDTLDTAYLRPGRVDLVLEMKEVITAA
jgi:hypothetical protein